MLKISVLIQVCDYAVAIIEAKIIMMTTLLTEEIFMELQNGLILGGLYENV